MTKVDKQSEHLRPDIRRARAKRWGALAIACPLSSCSGPDDQFSRSLEQWVNDATLERASSLLLTLAQVNVTILAFVLGLGIVTLQLAARYAIPNLRLQRGDAFFLLAYAGTGVLAPLLWSMQPSVVGALVLTIASFVFILAAPVRAARAARAGLPLEIARRAVRDLKQKSNHFSSRSQRKHLASAHHTLLAIRADTAPGAVRDQIQLYMQEVLLLALSARNEEAANRIVSSVLGGVDDGVEQRLEQFETWLDQHGETLSDNASATYEAWKAIRRICVDSLGEGRIEIATRATRLAATLATARVRAVYRGSQTPVEALDEWGQLYVRIFADTDVSQCLKDANELASLLAERAPHIRRGRPLFEAICTLFVEPSRHVSLSSYLPLEVPFEAASELQHQLAQGLRRGDADDVEIQFRMETLIEVPLQLLETLQATGCLYSRVGLKILHGYLRWIDDAAEQGSLWLVNVLVSNLRKRVEGKFFPPRSYRSTVAGTINTICLLRAAVEPLAATAAKLQHRYVDVEGWGSGSGAYAFFDVPSWGHERDMAAVARGFLPALEQEIWSQNFKKNDREERLDPLEDVDRHDVVNSWLMPTERPDVLLSVLLARWERALNEDYRRPGLQERRQMEQQVALLAEADPETREALEELFSRPNNPLSSEYLEKSLRVLKMARKLLHSSIKIQTFSSGIATTTLKDWQEAARAWLKGATGEDDPDIGQLVSGIRGLSREPSLVARDFRSPVEISRGSFPIKKHLWQTVFGYETANDRMVSRRQTAYERADLPPRTYCLLPQWEGSSHGYIVAIEEDHSCRLIVLATDDGLCEDEIPFSSRYLPDVILQDCLGDLLNCTTCFGLLSGRNWSALACPVCGGTGRLKLDDLIHWATDDFVNNLPTSGSAPARFAANGRFRRAQEDPRGRIKVFTSRALREHLATVLDKDSGQKGKEDGKEPNPRADSTEGSIEV